MTIKKTISGFYKKVERIETNDEGEEFKHIDTVWVPQQDVDMEPEEEKEILAHWAVGDSLSTQPKKPTREQEHEWLIEFSPAYIKQMRSEWQKNYSEWLLTHQPVVDAHRKAANDYEVWANSLPKIGP